MFRKTIHFFLFILLSVKVLCQSTPVIKAVKAYLYYNQGQNNNKAGGTFSDNIVDNQDLSLWNVVIGEGSAAGPSNSTMIVVELVQNDATESSGYVKFVVTDTRNKVLFSKEQRFSILEKESIFSAPFLVYDTGCEKIKIKVQLLDGTKKKIYSSSEKVLNFSCGE